MIQIFKCFNIFISIFKRSLTSLTDDCQVRNKLLKLSKPKSQGATRRQVNCA
nr:MAG TPA: hypothetical protein [Caudoviricetes sp.]